MKDSQESVDNRRERLQSDLDKTYTQTYNEELEKAMDILRNLQKKINGDEEHVNVLFEQQKESAKETGKPSSPENVKKVIDDFYVEEKRSIQKEKPEKVTIKIGIEYKDTKKNKEITFNMNDVSISWQKGIKKYYDDKGHCFEIKYNGHERIVLKAWKGCNSFDAFVTDS